MGNAVSGGGDAMGHGAGNCKEVGGDSCTGYLNKSSRIYKTRNENHWTKADTFQDSFNSYTTSVHQNVNMVGNNNVVLNRMTVHGGVVIAGRDVNNGSQCPPASLNGTEGDRNTDEEMNTVKAIEIAAIVCDKGHEAKVTQSFSLHVVSLNTGANNFEIPAGDLPVTWGDSEVTFQVTGVDTVAGMHKLYLTTGKPVQIGRLFGEAFTAHGRVLFEGHMKATDALPPVESKQIRMRVAVGQAHGPHRAMLNHASTSQREWDQGASMGVAGWSHHMEFWAFPTKQPGTIRIAVGQAHGPHRAMLNHGSMSQREWDQGASMSIAGWSHHMDFWAFPTRQPGTIRIAVGQAHDPHRTMINHSTTPQQQWNQGASMNTAGWKHHMDFWAYPVAE